MPRITKGTTNVTRYVSVVDDGDGSPETGATITNFNLQYTRYGEAPNAKADATALGSTGADHADNKMIEVDGTDSKGLYRVDWPDAAFALGAEGVILTVSSSDAFQPAIEDIQLTQDVVFSTGAAISTPPKDSTAGFTITWGENEANTEDSAHALDGTTHDIEAANDTTEKIDVYYEFSVGGDGIGTGVQWHGRLDRGGGIGKNIGVYAYDWDNTAFEQVGSIDSANSIENQDFTLFASHTGTGSDLGKVRIRFATGSVAFTTTTKLITDQILVEYAVVRRSVGYENGQIWVDTGASNTNTESFVDGVADNPVSTWAAALTLSGQVNLTDFHILNGSTIQLSGASTNYSLFGDNWTLDLNSQSMVGIHVEGADVSGVMAGVGANQSFRDCNMGSTSLIANTHMEACRISGTQTVVEAGAIWFDDCHSGVAASIAPILDYGAAIGDSDIHVRNYSGGLQVENMGAAASTDTLNLEGHANLIEGTCTGGVVVLRGVISLSGITNLTITEVARIAPDQIADNAGRIFDGTATASSSTTKVFVQAGDPPTGAADDDYNDTIIAVWRGTDKRTARMNLRTVTDYDDSDPSFTITPALGFTPLSGDLMEVYLADAGALASLSQLTTGFGTSSPDTLEAYLLAIMSKIASAPANAGTYDPATDSLEFLGERNALIEGSSFGTSTDSLAAIRDAIDTLIAPAVVGASSLSGSGFLSDCVTMVRRMTDEPSLLPKYTDADLVEAITSAMTVVMSEVHNNSDHNIICRFNIQLVREQQTYILPPNVGEIWAVRKMSDTTPVIPIYEAWPDNHWSSHQSGFVIEHNEFRLLTDWRSTDILEILYIPNGESFIHKATASSAAASQLIFPSTVTDGTLDTRQNAYAGYLLRILSNTDPHIQERIINSYDNITRKAIVTTPFSPVPSGTVVYEVLPTYGWLIKDAVCLQAAMDVLANEGNTKRLKTQTVRYNVKMRALRQMIAKKSSRFGGHMEGDTSDNDERGGFYGWLVL